jgi:hypothetical protein
MCEQRRPARLSVGRDVKKQFPDVSLDPSSSKDCDVGRLLVDHVMQTTPQVSNIVNRLKIFRPLLFLALTYWLHNSENQVSFLCWPRFGLVDQSGRAFLLLQRAFTPLNIAVPAVWFTHGLPDWFSRTREETGRILPDEGKKSLLAATIAH